MGARVHGSKAVLFLDNQSGACQNVTGDTNNITSNFSKNNPDSTTLGNNTMQRIDGLRDFTLDVSSIWETGDSGDTTIELLDEMYAGSLTTRAQYAPGGSVSGCPLYTASMRLATYSQAQPVDGIATANYSLQIASGSLVIASVA